MSSIIYGYEVKDYSTDTEIPDIEQDSMYYNQVSKVNKYLDIAIESYSTLYSIYSQTKDRDISLEESKFIQVTMDHVLNRLGLESQEYKPDTFSKLMDRVYLTIMTILDIAYELIVRFFKWFKEQFNTSSKKSSKITETIRYILNNSPKQEFSITFSSKEVPYFYTDEFGFDINETIALYTTLFSIYTKDTTLIRNVNQVISYKFQEKKYIPVEFNPIFPVIESKHYSNSLYEFIGPTLPRGRVLRAILFKDNTPTTDELVSDIDLCDISLGKANEKIKMSDETITLSREALMDVNNLQIQFSRQCLSVTTYTDKLISMLSRIRRQHRNINYQGSSNFDPQLTPYTNTNLSIIKYILRTVERPFFELNKAAQETETVLLNRLLVFVKKELKELK